MTGSNDQPDEADIHGNVVRRRGRPIPDAYRAGPSPATLPVMAKSFAAHGVTKIKILAIAGSGHWLSEEQPKATAAAIADFASEVFKCREAK